MKPLFCSLTLLFMLSLSSLAAPTQDSTMANNLSCTNGDVITLSIELLPALPGTQPPPISYQVVSQQQGPLTKANCSELDSLAFHGARHAILEITLFSHTTKTVKPA